ncbi:ribbon-helix-helix protein, CopG family [Cellulomonas sp. S1-8]|uniref:ribbon-helix-helix protein, CopG family n=1 Tax=Cellulomonas sp. S1-8 TaxID=2904790 RepID=UPI002242D6EC|nr:ribbon-helix-helix protein, CopG family [Cellulomonas sp. S1-8]UZN03010.1 ribbon-helix-helix protein, CopG family [Cellulomonas sp. S1-8]
MKTAISLPDHVAARIDASARRHGMTRSEFYRRAAERYATELERSDVTARIDAAIRTGGQPAADSAPFRSHAADVITQDEW